MSVEGDECAAMWMEQQLRESTPDKIRQLYRDALNITEDSVRTPSQLRRDWVVDAWIWTMFENLEDTSPDAYSMNFSEHAEEADAEIEAWNEILESSRRRNQK